jgi:hypothetical protein
LNRTLADGPEGILMKRLFMSAAVALLMAFGLSSAPAEAGTISLLDSTFAQPGGQGAGDFSHSAQLTPHSWEADHKFGSKNTTFVDTFKIAANAITGFTLDVQLFGTVDNITVKLFDHNGAAGGNQLITPISLSLASGTSDTSFTYTGAVIASVLAEPYVFLQVTGKFCSCAKYIITMTPVPPALIMFLTALGGMGLVGFWRSKGGALRAA